MIDLDTILIILAIVPVDSILVGYFASKFIERRYGKLFATANRLVEEFDKEKIEKQWFEFWKK